MTLRPVLNSARSTSSPVRLLLWVAAIPLLLSCYSPLSAEDSSTKRWTPAELADGVEAAIARVESSELSTRYFERRNTNAYGKGESVLAGGSGTSVFRHDGQRWYCDDDGFTTQMRKSETTRRRQVSGFDGTTHFDQNGDRLVYGEQNGSVWQFSPAEVFWGAARNSDFLIGRLRLDEAEIVADRIVDGLRQVTVQARWKWGETAYNYQVTLLPERSFLPIEARTLVNSKPDGEWSAEAFKQADGVWYPSKVSAKRFVGEKIERDKRTIVTRFRLRDDFAAPDFQLASTTNLDILDHRTGTGFHNHPWWSDLAPFLKKQLNWPRPDTHAASEYARYGNADLIGKPAPQLNIAEWISGEPTALTAPGRKLTAVIFFGGRAISPSPRSLSALRNLRALYQRNGFEVIGVASQSGTLDLTRRDVRSLTLNFPIGIDSSNDNPDGNRYGKTFDAYGLRAYYGFFLVDGTGVVREVSQEAKQLDGLLKPDEETRLGTLRANIVRYLHDAGEKDLDLGLKDLLRLDLKEIRQAEREWKRLLAEAPRTAQLSGTITDDDGPIAGVTIEAVPSLRLLFTNSPGGYFLSKDHDQTLKLQTDAEGHFTANGLPKGVWELTISKPGHASLEREVTLATAESATTLHIENKQKDRIFGRVLDQNGDPVVRATVKVDKRHPDPERLIITTTAHLPKQVGVTDQDGRFEITKLYDGIYTLVIDAANFESVTQPRISADGNELVIRLKLRKETASLISEPHRLATASALSFQRQRTRRQLSTRGLSGLANISDEPRKTETSLQTNASEPQLTVTGRVVDEEGQPISNCPIVIGPSSIDDQPGFSAIPTATIRTTALGETDSNGRFAVTLHDLSHKRKERITSKWRPVVCVCSILAPGYAASVQELTLKPESSWNIALKKVRLTPAGDLRVAVTTSTGAPIVGASVAVSRFVLRSATPPPADPVTQVTDQFGTARFPKLITHDFILHVNVTSPDGRSVTTRQVKLPKAAPARVTVSLDPTGSVTGQIHCTDQKQLAGMKLRLTTTPHPINLGGRQILIRRRRPSVPVIVQLDEKGRFQVDDIPIGRLVVQQLITPETTWLLHEPPFDFIVKDGQVTEYKADLKPGIPVEGFVIDRQNDHLLRDCRLALRSVDRTPLRVLPADSASLPLTEEANGRFHTVLTPGRYHISATNSIPGYSRITVRQFEVKPDDERVEVKVLVPRTLSMQAELVDEDGLPVGDAWVAALSKGKLLTLKRASDIGIFEAWLADVSRADSWQVRIGKRRLTGTVVKKVPLRLQVSLKEAAAGQTVSRK